jgi:hypothetical protein
MMTVALIDAMYYGAFLIFCLIGILGMSPGDGFKEMIAQGSLRRADARLCSRKSGQNGSIGEENRSRTTLIPGIPSYSNGLEPE